MNLIGNVVKAAGSKIQKTVLKNVEKSVLKEAGSASLTKGLDIIDIVKPKRVLFENLKGAKLLNAFKEIKHLEGEEFVRTAYSKILKHLGMEDIAPEFVYGARKDLDGLAGFSRLEGKIYIDPAKIADKADALNSLVHELKHADQYGMIARYEKGSGFSPASRLCFTKEEQKILPGRQERISSPCRR